MVLCKEPLSTAKCSWAVISLQIPELSFYKKLVLNPTRKIKRHEWFKISYLRRVGFVLKIKIGTLNLETMFFFLSHSKINFKPIKPIQLQGLFYFPVLFLALYQKYKTQIVLTHKYLSLTKRFSICVYYSYSSCPCIYDIFVFVVVVMTDHS